MVKVAVADLFKARDWALTPSNLTSLAPSPSFNNAETIVALSGFTTYIYPNVFPKSSIPAITLVF